MRFFKMENADGSLRSIGTGMGGTEITREEYLSALDTIRAKADWVNRVFQGAAQLSDVPPEWQEEVERRVAERAARVDDPELTEAEALEILLGGAE